jgi:hypothetical protein
MGFPLGRVVSVAARILSAIVTAVPAVEALAKTIKTGTGAEKRAAVLDVVATELAAAELLVGRDLANDGDVLDAAGKVTDAYVALQKVLARKVAALNGT